MASFSDSDDHPKTSSLKELTCGRHDSGYQNADFHKCYQKAGIPRKLGFTETVPESGLTQKAGMVAKICPLIKVGLTKIAPESWSTQKAGMVAKSIMTKSMTGPRKLHPGSWYPESWYPESWEEPPSPSEICRSSVMKILLEDINFFKE